ncbi:MAG: hypothetical protein AAF716_18335 [Cyanobacteria bacterium P01_D01_bin.1]
MLAYTTVTDIFQLPTALEAIVYLGGLAFVLVSPYLFLSTMDKISAATKPSQEIASASKAQGD